LERREKWTEGQHKASMEGNKGGGGDGQKFSGLGDNYEDPGKNERITNLKEKKVKGGLRYDFMTTIRSWAFPNRGDGIVFQLGEKVQ